MKRCEQCKRILWQENFHLWCEELRAADELRWGVFSIAMAALALILLFVAWHNKEERISLLLFLPFIGCMIGFITGIVKLLMVARRCLK